MMTIPFNPNMVVLARESRGLTQKEFADRLHVTQGYVSKLEAGLIAASEECVIEISRVLNYPRTFFFQMDAVYSYGSTCLYHRKRQSLPMSDLRRIIADLNVLRIGMGKLLRSVDIKPLHEFPRMDIADFNDSPEYIAQLLRGAWNLQRGPIQNITLAIENAGGVVVRCSFGSTKIDAMSQWVPGSLPLFFVNADIPTDRFRFSLAHELGHIIMHQVPTNDLEREADSFASEFLMPGREIGPQLHGLSVPRLAQLKPLWKVSMAALTKRALELGKITQRHYRTILTQMGKAGIRMDEPSSLPPERPELLSKIIGIHRKQHGYTLAELSRLVCLDESEFRARYLSEVGKLRVVG
jgi:Zn-dependent peptidase ImmA (M78 family)/transcriptional regulator with XRE-family HTH domain